MDFLGRVEAVLGEMAARHLKMGRDSLEILESCGLRLPETREAYSRLASSASLQHAAKDEAGSLSDGAKRAIAIAEADAVEDMMISPAARGVDLLWRHWLLVLSEREGVWSGDPALLTRLWDKAFSRQVPAGHLHPLDAETSLDAFVYDELCAIHAAYRSAIVVGNPGMMEQVRRMVQWHVEQTQPDHTTAEPWGLAAFAALDETGTFAEQQLLDTRAGGTFPRGNFVVMALLADAVLAMRDARGVGG